MEIRCTTLESQLDRNKGVESPTKLLSELEILKEQFQSEADASTVFKGQNRELRKVHIEKHVGIFGCGKKKKEAWSYVT